MKFRTILDALKTRSPRTRTRRPQSSFALQAEVLEVRSLLSGGALNVPLTQPAAVTPAQVGQAYSQIPLSFEANQGQVDPQVDFLSHGSGYTLFLKPNEAVLTLDHASGASGQGAAGEGTVLRMEIVGGNPLAQASVSNKQTNTSNYFVGNDPNQWQTGIANYGKVTYHDVYSGVDLVYYGNQQQLEYDFNVAPGADPKAIRLAFQGAAGMELDSQGNLVLHTAGDDVVERAPVLYQETNGMRQAVSGHYVLEGNDQVAFQVGTYDATRPLVIDPLYSLVYSTYLGGSGGSSAGYGIAVDGSGNAYVTGTTGSTKFPTTAGAFQTTGGGAFVTKFNAAGSALLYSTFLSGAFPSGIALDTSGDAYITGVTGGNLSTKNALQASYGGGSHDAFVTKLNPTGSALLYATYLGGSGDDQARGIAVDSSGNAYVTGLTYSSNFPTTPGTLQPVIGGSAYLGFVAKLNSPGTALVYATYLGNGAAINESIIANGIAVDSSANAYVTGFAGNFPTTPGAFQTAAAAGSTDAFVAKLNATGSALVYGTFLGGSGTDKGYRIAVDGAGNAYVTGLTQSTNFPTTPGAFQSTFGGGTGDAFVTELNAAGSALVYSTYLGGSGNENDTLPDPVGGIAVDSSGHIYVTGTTSPNNWPTNLTNNFPTKNALQAAYGGGQIDAFVAELDPSQAGAASLVYSTYLGGSDQDISYGIAVDGSGNAYVTGRTYSFDFPTKNAYQPKRTKQTGQFAISDAFVTKIDPPADVAVTAVSTRQVIPVAATDSTSAFSNGPVVIARSEPQTLAVQPLLSGVPLGQTLNSQSSMEQPPAMATIATPSKITVATDNTGLATSRVKFALKIPRGNFITATDPFGDTLELPLGELVS